jgi:hypothetical protein
MAKLQVPMDDNLLKAAKLHAIQHDTTLKDLISEALKAYIGTTPTITSTSNTMLHSNTTNTTTTPNTTSKSNTSSRPTKKKKPEPEPVIVADEEYVPMEVTVDEDMDWQPPTTQDFYGKFEPPAYLKPGEFDHDPLKYSDPIEETTIKPKKVEDDDWKAF